VERIMRDYKIYFVEVLEFMLTPDKLKKAFKKVEDENWVMRAFLKGQEPEEVDKFVNGLHKELFKVVDCVACSNCCKEIVPTIEENEIQTISARLGIADAEFKEKYLVKTDDGLMINKKPCPFITETGCSIYECRPESCREYPYTHKDEIWSRLINLVNNCGVCPVVYEIFERLKKYYTDEFEEYKEEFEEMWG
jgi:hypothetical protein